MSKQSKAIVEKEWVSSAGKLVTLLRKVNGVRGKRDWLIVSTKNGKKIIRSVQGYDNEPEMRDAIALVNKVTGEWLRCHAPG